MAVLEETPLASSLANGVTTVFPHLFSVPTAADLVVQSSLDGVVTTYTSGVDYTVAGLGTGSGSVTFAVAPASGATVTRYRSTKLQRLTDYQDGGDLPADTLNADFDRQVLLLQEIVAGAKGTPGSIRAPAGVSLNELPGNPADFSGYYIGIVAGQPVYLLAPTGTAGALAGDLAGTAIGKGAALIGNSSSVTYAFGTVGAELARTVWLDAFGADPTGAADSTSAYNAAKVKYGAATVVRLTPGAVYKFTSAISMGGAADAGTIVCDGYATIQFSGIDAGTDCFTMNGDSYRRMIVSGAIFDFNTTGRDGLKILAGDHPILDRVLLNNSTRDAFVQSCSGFGWIENGRWSILVNNAGRHACRMELTGADGAFINECTWEDFEIRGVSKITAGGKAIYVTSTASGTGSKFSNQLFQKSNIDATYTSGSGVPIPSVNIIEADSGTVENWRFLEGGFENIGTNITGGYTWACTGTGTWTGLTVDSSITNSNWGALGPQSTITRVQNFSFSDDQITLDSPLVVGGRSRVAGAASITTNTGVTFAATQVPSTDLNTLDDYEEVGGGSAPGWTPTLTNGTTGATSYFWRRGYAHKIGNRVYGEVQLSVDTLGITGALKITGLPYPIVSDVSLGTATAATFLGFISSGKILVCQIVQTAPTTIALALSTVPGTPLPHTEISSGTQILIQFQYSTTA